MFQLFWIIISTFVLQLSCFATDPDATTADCSEPCSIKKAPFDLSPILWEEIEENPDCLELLDLHPSSKVSPYTGKVIHLHGVPYQIRTLVFQGDDKGTLREFIRGIKAISSMGLVSDLTYAYGPMLKFFSHRNEANDFLLTLRQLNTDHSPTKWSCHELLTLDSSPTLQPQHRALLPKDRAFKLQDVLNNAMDIATFKPSEKPALCIGSTIKINEYQYEIRFFSYEDLRDQAASQEQSPFEEFIEREMLLDQYADQLKTKFGITLHFLSPLELQRRGYCYHLVLKRVPLIEVR